MKALRVAGFGAIAVPSVVALALLLFTWLTPAINGAGMSEENRPLGFVLIAAFGAGGWLLGSSGMFSIFLPPAWLPRLAQPFAGVVIRGPRFVPSTSDETWRQEPAVTDEDRSISLPRLLGLALVELPLFMFSAPMLTGWLLQGDVYRPFEATVVGAMAIVATAWAAFLVFRAASGGKTTPG